MYFQNDWMMRQIEMTTALIAKLIFNKDRPVYEIQEKMQESKCDLLHARILDLISQGEICRAEDTLFEMAEETNLDYLSVAVDFYHSLNLYSDIELEEMNFSREEISEGLNSFMAKYNVNLSN